MFRHRFWARTNAVATSIVMLILLLAMDRVFLGPISPWVEHKSSLMLAKLNNVQLRLSAKRRLVQKLRTAESENNKSQLALLKYRAQLDAQKLLLEELDELKMFLDVKTHRPTLCFAQVLRSSNARSDAGIVLQLNQPCVKKGMFALSASGVLLGRVAAISKQLASVVKPSNLRSAIPVIIGDAEISAIAIGNGSDVDLIYIPIDAVIHAGDIVQVQSSFLPGSKAVLGYVSSIQEMPDKSFLLAKVSIHTKVRAGQWLMLS